MPYAKHSCSNLIIGSLALTLCLVSTTLAQDAQRDVPQPPKIIRKSGGVFQGSATRRVEPAYPPLAKAARVSGSVVVEVTADEEGNVISARAISGHPLLKDAAVEAAKGWRFAPTMLTGVPVKVIGIITFNFNLDYSKDIEMVKQQLAAEPNSAQLHQKLGDLFNADRQHEKAIEEYNQALSLGGDSAQVFFGLGEAYQTAGRFGEAIEVYKRGLPLNSLPGFAEMINMRLGEAYLKQDRNEDALQAFKQAVTASPDSPLAHYQLGLTYLKIGDKQSALNEYMILKDLNEQMAEALHRSLEKEK
ncbi:MAG: TonB family protein [Acidobacteriota bacterium]